MKKKKAKPSFSGAAIVAVLAMAAMAVALGGEKVMSLIGSGKPVTISRQAQGEVFGALPKLRQPGVTDPLVDSIGGPRVRQVVIKRIPRITRNMRMPHPYWGDCANCHLFKDGPGPGQQWKTPVGSALEAVSTIIKVGPPIRPNANRPHPPAGRCIKCHDIVIDAPV